MHGLPPVSVCPEAYKELDPLLNEYLTYFKYVPNYHLTELFNNTCYDKWNIEVTQDGELRWYSKTDYCQSQVILKLLDYEKGRLIGSKTLFNPIPDHQIEEYEVKLNDDLSFEAARLLSKLTCEDTSVSQFNYNKLAVKIAVYAPLVLLAYRVVCQSIEGKVTTDVKKLPLVAIATVIAHLTIDYLWPS